MNIKILAAAAVFSTVAAMDASAGERMKIWPEGKMPDAQPHQIAAMTDEVKASGFNPDEHRDPYLEWFEPPANPNGTCMILISGGAYQSCCDGRLIEMWNEKFTGIGCQCVNFVYRTPRPKGVEIWRTAWEDGQRAVRIVRREAAKRGFDPEKIGVISMSAGSHLNTLLATSSQTPACEPVDDIDRETPCHINWAITGAIAYGVDDGLTGPNTRNGQAIDAKLDSIFKFDEKTAPMCMFHGGKDLYSPMSSTLVYRELRKRKVPAELHLFADRNHGFWGQDGKGDKATAYDNWFGRAHEFMVQMGFLGGLKPEVALRDRFATDFHDPAKYEKRDLWPDGKMPDRQLKEDGKDAQCTPYLEWYIPANLKTKAIQIVYSGGGYSGNGPDGFEVKPFRRYLNEKGMAVVTMKYRTPRPAAPLAKHTTAWQDLQRCIRIVRSEAAGRGLDPNRIGIMGSSAGGHLTLMGATSARSRAYWPVDGIDKLPCNVQWGVGIYPAYALTDGVNRPNTDGGNLDDARLVPEFAFDPDTCPMVFIHGDADGWAAMNSVKAWEQMRRMGIQSDLHTLALRKHCFQKDAVPGTGSYTWMDRIWEFMNHKGFNK